ncbi:FYVE zinc finger domain-containing protein [Phytophthora infestans]|uniref:FYVE zinc finger domain-containing protein n=1 Tax=Phytophthora infestans TaxID=4787 RepID=A0A833VXE1_PHYIN|nr:FYVE zinc finger domain-containing protein [Phytophthora infestans]
MLCTASASCGSNTAALADCNSTQRGSVQQLHLLQFLLSRLSALTFHFSLPLSNTAEAISVPQSHPCIQIPRRHVMAIAVEASSPSARIARVTPGSLFRRMSAQAMGMEAAALCHRSHWVPKSSRSSCSNCHRSFRLWAGKHHCRLCGEIVCGTCSTKRILFQKKSVRTCDDCVHANVQSISEVNRRRSTPEFLHSYTSPAAFGDIDDRYERHSLQVMPLRTVNSRGLQRHHSSFVSTGSRREIVSNMGEEDATSFKEMTLMNYSITFSWQTQIMSLVIAALVVSIACALKLMAQV